MPLLCSILDFTILQVFSLLFFCLLHFSSPLYRSDWHSDRSTAPPASLHRFSFSGSICISHGVSKETVGTREQTDQIVVRALDLAVNTLTLSLMHRPGLGPVLLLVHSLHYSALAVLASELLLQHQLFGGAILGLFVL